MYASFPTPTRPPLRTNPSADTIRPMSEADRYRVVSAGREFGPTDLTGLMQWVKEGRLAADTQLRKNDAAPVAAPDELIGVFQGQIPGIAAVAPPPIGSLVVRLPSEFRVTQRMSPWAGRSSNRTGFPLRDGLLVGIMGSIPTSEVLLPAPQDLHGRHLPGRLGILSGRKPSVVFRASTASGPPSWDSCSPA